MKVIFTQGLPASGKSTWSKNFCIKNKDWVRVSRDDLRNMRGQYWIPKQEKLISHWEQELVATALDHKKNVIVDATNFNKKYVKQIKDMCKMIDENVEFETKVFNVSVEECIKRDLKREASVGEKVIRGMYDKYLKKDIRIKQVKGSLPNCVICDLDGTLAIHNGRSPYEYEKCDTDLVNEAVRTILWQTTGTTAHLIFMSGRDDSCKERTEKWLKDTVNISRDYDLYMRKTGDDRPDYIVKKELFDNHVKDKFYVEFVLDDRNQVVRLWRDLGLTCLQVAEGEF